MPKFLRTLITAAILVAAAAAPAASAQAQTLASEAALRRTVYVPRDKSLSYRLSQPAAKIVIAQPEIAKVTATGDSSFYVQGMEFGSTNMLVYGPGGRLMEVIDIRVGYDAASLQHDLANAYPNEPIQVRNLGESLMLVGEVSNSGVQARAEQIAEKYAPEAVISRLQVRDAQQVVLEVRVLEATRSALQDIGFTNQLTNNSFNFATGSGGLIGQSAPAGVFQLFGGVGNISIDNSLVALEEKGVIRTLARPNLVAISGQKATFHAGGEYPYPVPQRDNVLSLEFRKYGVELTFTPFVQDNGLIRLEVEPKVSQLDFTNSLRILGFTVPGLIIRQTKTTVELRDNEALSIGGLFQREYANSMRQVPGIGNVPVLGALLRSTRWKQADTELIVIVTPRYTTAADKAKAAAMQAPPGKEPKALDLIFGGKALDRPLTPEEGR
ncbi:type II and III secretion system protein family protein [Phenylobacterium sp.]|uniref:type II and III secretion system protein family protein n=1 Tax=Phenylobacterium sp. TaxID=1871053 RepID=UPI0025D1573A|nr:type II and III secretion system protein family protein [Phenylobacterium sp.]MBX3481913.1 type II and III secretion system protein family protein [Phenylobacterium sp.]MCW5760096.1 type II and III secretion system protein family protein [Phenylobacterium sp.]